MNMLHKNRVPYIAVAICCCLIFVHNVKMAKNSVTNESHSSIQFSSFSPIPSDNCFTSINNNSFPEPTGFVVMHGKKTPMKGNLQQLKYFYDALNKAKQKKMRIAHWGDSILMGDVISENLRENLQKQFGGNGAGFVSINTDGIRTSTRATFSADWKESSLFTRNQNKLPLGINGAVFVPVDGSWVKYETGKVSKHLRGFSVARLFYANVPAGGTVNCLFSNGSSRSIKLDGGKNLKVLDIYTPNGTTSITCSFYGCQNGYFYGVSLENGDGVYVDNLPIRGNSGVSLSELPLGLLKEFNSIMNYKFLIINFGVNVVSSEHANYLWYETQMEKVVDYFKEAFPQASILLVSVGDKGIKKGTKFITDPGIFPLVQSQESIANKKGIAFWNMFEAMGGQNIIDDWVNANPALAYKDYCHLTSEGGKLIADLLTDALLDEMKKSH